MPTQLFDAPRLNGVLLDLVAGLVSRELDTEPALPPEARARNLVLTIRSFILRNFCDPQLTPRTVADAHHLSTRHLHRLFQTEGVTVAALIRHRRVEQARRELADPALLDLPVQAIAARCGFTASAHFSRTFRSAYGVSPSEYRKAEHRQLTKLSTVRGTARRRRTSATPAGRRRGPPSMPWRAPVARMVASFGRGISTGAERSVRKASPNVSSLRSCTGCAPLRLLKLAS
ncbi:helix-turn-helix transcriptional regulator [Streptomyces mutabilis]|uniref:helix-turn-helix transcriptional regulator n=1 Tax=Streptomyces mutabilis TaxID=67332 RepID=UPI00365F97C4